MFKLRVFRTIHDAVFLFLLSVCLFLTVNIQKMREKQKNTSLRLRHSFSDTFFPQQFKLNKLTMRNQNCQQGYSICSTKSKITKIGFKETESNKVLIAVGIVINSSYFFKVVQCSHFQIWTCHNRSK